MKQATFSGLAWSSKGKVTRRERFLAEMDAVIPWSRLLALIEPHYPSTGQGRPPIGLERMLRVYFLQQWFNLSDPQAEDSLYDSESMRCFAGIELSDDRIPDETTILRFRHLLEERQLTEGIFAEVRSLLEEKRLLLKSGTIVDATILAAPPSTKNAEGARDPEMRQTKKGNQWHFGMKAHIGVDADSGLVHTVATTAANEADVEQVQDLLHGKEQVVHADAGYTGAQTRVERKGLCWQIAAKRGQIGAMNEGRDKRALERIEKRKASIRAKVEHPFRVIKRQFGLMKVRFRGLAKNTAHVLTLFALSNLWMARKRLMAMTGKMRPQYAK